jgi:hypothetical protein
MITQTELEELIREHGLAPYVYIKSEKEQFKINLMSRANYITWRENPHQTALLTIAKDTNHKNIIKKLNQAKRMIDQERLRVYDGLTDIYKLILEKRQVKNCYEKLLTVLEQVRDNDQSNPWFLVFAQNQIYKLIPDLDITNDEANILKGISGYRYREDTQTAMTDPLLTEQQRIFHKVSVNKTKLNKFIQFVKNEIAEIERYTK